jgi:hypothetical protein
MRDLTSLLVDSAQEAGEIEEEITTEIDTKKRDYSSVNEAVVSHYRNLRSKQTHAHVKDMHIKFKTRERRPLQIWKALEIM